MRRDRRRFDLEPRWRSRALRIALLFGAHFLPTWLLIFLAICLLSSPTNTAPSGATRQRSPLFSRGAGGSGMYQVPYFNEDDSTIFSAVNRRPTPQWSSYLSPPPVGRSQLYQSSSYVKLPFNVILVLPSRESNNDKFGLTSEKARPVIDIAIEDVVEKWRLMPPNWINLTYHDSRYWEDTLLAERWATTGVVQAYCEKRLDAILGFADAYSLATVSKISAGFGDGVPVLTTTGLNSQIGSKKSYPFVTRMLGSYTQMAEATFKFIAYRDRPAVDSRLPQYKNLVFMYHDKRRALNRPQIQGWKGENADDLISSHCYFSLHAIKNHFKEASEYFKESWKVQTPYVAFDEELNTTREETKEWLRMASEHANGLSKREYQRLRGSAKY